MSDDRVYLRAYGQYGEGGPMNEMCRFIVLDLMALGFHPSEWIDGPDCHEADQVLEMVRIMPLERSIADAIIARYNDAYNTVVCEYQPPHLTTSERGA